LIIKIKKIPFKKGDTALLSKPLVFYLKLLKKEKPIKIASFDRFINGIFSWFGYPDKNSHCTKKH